MGPISFRPATPSDAAALGRLHVASWHETYAGLLPDELLEGLSAQASAAMWGAALNDPAAHGGAAAFVAESERRLVGFGACADQRDEALSRQGFDGEFGAIYVLQAHQRAGAGRSLMSLMAQALSDRGRGAASLRVLRENANARRFYEGLGGALLGEKLGEHAGAMVPEVTYGWRNLGLLIGQRPQGLPR